VSEITQVLLKSDLPEGVTLRDLGETFEVYHQQGRT